MMRFIRCLIVVNCLFSPALLMAAGGGYQGGGALQSSAAVMSPEELAIAAYNSGLKRRDRAWEYEQKAEQVGAGKKQKKFLGKAQKSYFTAIKKFKKAIQYNPELYQAYSSLGYALRKTGALEQSLEAYQQSLSINPDYPEAIEYLAETHMHLHKYDAVRAAYGKLAKAHPEYADKLLSAVYKWLDSQGGIDNDGLKEFSLWAHNQKN